MTAPVGHARLLDALVEWRMARRDAMLLATPMTFDRLANAEAQLFAAHSDAATVEPAAGNDR